MIERPYSASTAAEFLGCSEQTIRNLCAAGKLRSFRVGCSPKGGGPLRISAEAMAEYLRQCDLFSTAVSGAPTTGPKENPGDEASELRIERLLNDC